MKFPAGGLARVALSWRSSARKIRATLVGERGSLFVDDDFLEKISISGSTAPDVIRKIIPSNWDDSSHSLWLLPVISEFFEAIDRKDPIPHQTEIALHLGAIFEDFSEIRTALTQRRSPPVQLRLLQGMSRSLQRSSIQNEQKGAVS